MNGFGSHRIEGIGDKHVPWVHNLMNTDAVAAIDDEDCMRVFRLFNETEGKSFLNGEQRSKNDDLSLLGISGICNLLAAIKTAKYYEMNENEVIFTIFTDSSDLYQSRLRELEEERGTYSTMQAAKDFAGPLAHQGIDAGVAAACFPTGLSAVATVEVTLTPWVCAGISEARRVTISSPPTSP